jgi:hypothetical protein
MGRAIKVPNPAIRINREARAGDAEIAVAALHRITGVSQLLGTQG